MENKHHLKRIYKSFITVLAVVLALAAFVLYPRGPYGITDGGSEIYMGLGRIYSVMFLNQLPDSFDENGIGYYQTGIEITVLGKMVYEDRHPDYSKPFTLRRHSTEIEKVREEIERAMGGSQTSVSKEHKDEQT